MRAAAGPGPDGGAVPENRQPDDVTIPRATLRRWCEMVEFALDADERERVDALLELAAVIEEWAT